MFKKGDKVVIKDDSYLSEHIRNKHGEIIGLFCKTLGSNIYEVRMKETNKLLFVEENEMKLE